jgi:hypothetical protein
LNDLIPFKDSALAEYVEITLILNPLAKGERLVVRIMAGQTLDQMIATLVLEESDREHIAAFIGGDYIPQELWAKTRPKSGASIYLRVTLQDPVSMIAILASAVAPTIATAIFPTLVAGSFLASVAGAAIAMAITYAASALFGPRPTSVNNRKESPSYNLSAARNGLTPYAPVPVVLGTHRMVPPYGATPYTEIVGNDQFLRFILVWGYGPVDVSSIKIGNTDIADYTDVEMEHDFAGSSPTLGLYPADASQEDLSIRLTDAYVARTTALNTTEFGLTVTFPMGLFKAGDNGGRQNFSVQIIGQYRLVGSGTWLAWFDQTYTDKIGQAKRVSQRKTGLASGQYEIQIKRGDVEKNLTNPKKVDRADWTDLRSFNTNAIPINLTGVAKSAFRIKATDQLNGIVQQLNALVSLKIPTWDGSAWTTSTSVTSNPAAIYRYVLKGAPNKKPVAAANINDAQLGAWFTFCATNGLAFDQVLDFQLSVRDILQDVSNAGKASPAYVDDKWTVVIEQTRSTIVQHFTPRNTRNFAGRILYNEIPEALRIRFFNKNADYREDERVVFDDGFNEANATTYQVIDLPGQTNPDNVYKLGRHYIAAARLRPELFTFEVDIEHLVALRGDLCRLTHDVPSIGQMSGRVVSRSANTIVLDELVTREAGKTYTLRVRTTITNTSLALTVAAVGTTVTSATVIVTSGGTSVNAGDLFQFGEQSLESLEVLVAGIEYIDDLGASVTCVPYSPEIYSSATTIPAYTTVLSTPVSASFVGPPRPTISQVVSDEAALQITSTGSIIPAILLYVQAGKTAAVSDGTVTRTSFFQARYRRSGSEDPFTYAPYSAVDAPFILLTPVENGINYDIGVRAIGPDESTTSAFVEIANHQVLGATAKPPAIDTFSLNTIGDHTYVEWTYPSIAVDVIGYEIRYSADQNNTAWSTMTVLSDAIPREARSFTIPSRSGSYGIKPIDVLGNRSVAALYINASLEDPAALNVILTLPQAPAWAGTKTDIELYTGDIQLESQNFMSAWTTLASVPIIGFTAATGYALEGYYEFGETDLSQVYTSRITADAVVSTSGGLSTLSTWVTLSGVATIAGADTGDEVQVEIQVNYSIVDSATPVYQGWRRFVVGDYTARHLKFRVAMSTLYSTITPTMSALSVSIDMPDRIDQGNDLVSGAGSYAVSFSPWFREIRSITIAAQNMQTGDYYEISGKTRTGFNVIFRNSAGAAISRTFDYQAIGFGRERGT